MDSKYIFKGVDITLDIYEKIREVVELIAEKESKSFDESYADFSESKSFKSLQKVDSLMWSESVQFIMNEYYNEILRNQKIF